MNGHKRWRIAVLLALITTLCARSYPQGSRSADTQTAVGQSENDANGPPRELERDRQLRRAKLAEDADLWWEAGVATLKAIGADPRSTGEYVADVPVGVNFNHDACRYLDAPIAAVSQAVRQEPNRSATLVNLATVCSPYCADCSQIVQDLGFSAANMYVVPEKILLRALELDSNDVAAWTKLAQNYNDLGPVAYEHYDRKKELDALNKALALDPDNRRAFKLMSEYFLSLWDYQPQQAIAPLTKAIPLFASSPGTVNRLKCRLAEAYAGSGDRVSALSILHDVKDLASIQWCGALSELFKLATADFENANYDQAAQTYAAISKFGAELNIDGLFNLASSYVQINQIENAAAAAKKLVQQVDSRGHYPAIFYQFAGWLIQARTASSLGHYVDVVTAINRLQNMPGLYEMKPRDYAWLGYSYEISGDYSDALATFENASRLFPTDEDLFYRSLLAALAEGGEEKMEQVWARRSYHTDNYPRLSVLTNTLMSIADAADKQNLLYAALTHYSRVFALSTSFSQYNDYNQGTSPANQAGATGLKALTRALAIYKQLPLKPDVPLPAYAFSRLAEADVRVRNPNGAVQHYFQAIQAAPWWPEAYFNLAIAMRANNMYAKETIPVMRKYLELAPDGQYASAAQRKIDDWLKHPDVPLRYRVIPD